MTAPMMDDDLIQPFQVEPCGLRGRLVRLGPALVDLLSGQDYPPVVARLLGQAAALAAVLASSLKYDGLFTLQIKGDGPVSMLVLDVSSDGDMRGYARFERDRIDGLDGADVPHLLGAGQMAFTVDQGADTERYQGITELEGATLGECAQAYFRTSEQLETAILLACNGERAGGLMVQRLPDAAGEDPDDAEENWRRGVILASSAKAMELTDESLPAQQLLLRLFHEDGVRVYDPRPLRFNCRCSYEKVEATLKAFPVDQVADMVVDDRIEVTCEFCQTTYVMDGTPLKSLLEPE
ncbi:Hsp33 family molecular chaperone HslO [Magnetospira sp. QH-2]|uniref:Hsp33 family molecular chaperone HslO n=1 Tax=Magnetospira sp. (strain QH-2) TaxID=1288970 RepID=UPI0003E80DF0|nr:Hsp33 family molecular chaperone HslO [Magnetospira sp. QH-2]CCQ75340.1 33 kDa chaperonin [Magnetospira sp. QH-2]